MNALLLEIISNLLCTVIGCGNNLFVVSEANIYASFGNIAVGNKLLYALHNRNKVVFHIESASAPDKLAVIVALKRIVLPIVPSTLVNRNNILMSQKSNAIKRRIFALPLKDKACVTDFSLCHRLVNKRIAFLQEFVELIKLIPINQARVVI